MILNWFDTLLQYNFNIIHISGKDNIVPDCLSRMVRLGSLNDKYELPPLNIQKQLLETAHLSGHFGPAAIINHINLLGYSWTTLRADALELIKYIQPVKDST